MDHREQDTPMHGRLGPWAEEQDHRCPPELRSLAERLDALAEPVPEGLEDRVYAASVRALRAAPSSGRRAGRRAGWSVPAVVGRIGMGSDAIRRLVPLAAAAGLALLAWGGWSWLGPGPAGTSGQAGQGGAMVAQDAPALDEQVLEALTYVGLFADDTWAATLAEDAQELETPWEPSAESWSLDGLMGAG